MNNNLRNRISWVDCGKGASILLVALGHSPALFLDYEYLLWLKSCRVPFFFFLSGMFLSYSISTKEYATKRFKTLLLPFFSGGIIAIVGSSFLSNNNILNDRWLGLFYGSFHYLEWGPMWFLPQLFLVSIAAHFFAVRVKIFDRLSFLSVPIIIFVLLAWSSVLKEIWIINWSYDNSDYKVLGWPFGADIAFISVCFFLLGSYYKNFNIEMSKYISYFLVVIILSLFMINILFNKFFLDLALRKYDHFFYSSISAVIGISFMVLLVKFLSKNKLSNNILSFFSKFSLVILIFHEVIERRAYSVFDDIGYEKNMAGLFAFLLCIIVPILIQSLVISKFKISAFLFGVKYSGFYNLKAAERGPDNNRSTLV